MLTEPRPAVCGITNFTNLDVEIRNPANGGTWLLSTRHSINNSFRHFRKFFLRQKPFFTLFRKFFQLL